MKDYQHVLLAVDFFEYDVLIGKRAKELAEKYQAKLSIIHILDPLPITDVGLGGEMPINIDLLADLEASSKLRLAKMAANLAIPEEQQFLETGDAKYEITRIASERNVDLIVVGSHSRHGLALMLGSTTDGIIHRAPCDVLAVHLADAH